MHSSNTPPWKLFYGNSPGSGTDPGTTVVAGTLAEILVNKKNRKDDLSKMLENLATGMTNV